MHSAARHVHTRFLLLFLARMERNTCPQLSARDLDQGCVLIESGPGGPVLWPPSGTVAYWSPRLPLPSPKLSLWLCLDYNDIPGLEQLPSTKAASVGSVSCQPQEGWMAWCAEGSAFSTLSG